MANPTGIGLQETHGDLKLEPEPVACHTDWARDTFEQSDLSLLPELSADMPAMVSPGPKLFQKSWLLGVGHPVHSGNKQSGLRLGECVGVAPPQLPLSVPLQQHLLELWKPYGRQQPPQFS